MNQDVLDSLAVTIQKQINAKLTEEFTRYFRACFDENGKAYYVTFQLPDGLRTSCPLASLLPFPFLKVVRIRWMPLPVGSR